MQEYIDKLLNNRPKERVEEFIAEVDKMSSEAGLPEVIKLLMETAQAARNTLEPKVKTGGHNVWI